MVVGSMKVETFTRLMFIAERLFQCHSLCMNASLNGTVIAITPAQCRAARAFLNLSQDQLAEQSRVPKRTLVRFELGEGVPRGTTVEAIRTALEAAGVQFIEQNGGGPGVRLKNRLEGKMK